jgi:hypothetical protein
MPLDVENVRRWARSCVSTDFFVLNLLVFETRQKFPLRGRKQEGKMVSVENATQKNYMETNEASEHGE